MSDDDRTLMYLIIGCGITFSLICMAMYLLLVLYRTRLSTCEATCNTSNHVALL
jgi:hypothetical protein